MENFFDEENYCSDIEDLMRLHDIEEDNVKDLPEDWCCKVEMARLEPMFQLDADYVADMLYNDHEDRYGEDAPQHDEIIKILKQQVDFDKLNAAIPKLYYPNNIFVEITKADLIDFVS